MPPFRDLIAEGKTRFGKLTLLGPHRAQPLGKKRPTKATQWLVRCDCGTEKWMFSNVLNSDSATSCGCVRREKFKEYVRGGGRAKYPLGERTLHAHYRAYEISALREGREFALEFGDFAWLTQQNCFYCNSEPGIPNDKKRRAGEEEIRLNGVDRIDSKIGYVFDNCVTCCDVCNWLKSDHDASFFLDHIKKIIRHCEETQPLFWKNRELHVESAEAPSTYSDSLRWSVQ